MNKFFAATVTIQAYRFHKTIFNFKEYANANLYLAMCRLSIRAIGEKNCCGNRNQYY